MIKKATCFAAILLMAACSSGTVSKDSAKDQPASNNSEVEAYEQNETTLSGEQNNKDFVNTVDDKALVSALRDGGHVIYIRHAKTTKDWGDQVSPELDLADCSTQRRLSDEGRLMPKRSVKASRPQAFLLEMSSQATTAVRTTQLIWLSAPTPRTQI